MPKYNKGSPEMKAHMEKLRSMRKSKSGKGIGSDIINRGKELLIETGKNQLSDIIDKGAVVLKKKIKGEGFLGNIGKSLSNTLIDNLPAPNIVKNVAKYGTNELINQTGLGMIQNNNKKIKLNNKKIKGGALVPSGY